MTIYYVVLIDGIPKDVTINWGKAEQSRKELSVRGKDAIIIPCVSAQKEFDFSSEEPTEPMSDKGPHL